MRRPVPLLSLLLLLPSAALADEPTPKGARVDTPTPAVTTSPESPDLDGVQLPLLPSHQRVVDLLEVDVSAPLSEEERQVRRELERGIEAAKTGELIEALRIQARFAREVGTDATTAELDAAAKRMLTPVDELIDVDPTRSERRPAPLPRGRGSRRRAARRRVRDRAGACGRGVEREGRRGGARRR